MSFTILILNNTQQNHTEETIQRVETKFNNMKNFKFSLF